MELRPDQMNTLVPDGFPPESLVTPQVRELSSNLEDERLRRSFLWASAIVSAGLQSRVSVETRFSHFSAGFVAVTREHLLRSELPEADGFSFGGNILVKGDEAEQRIIPLEVGRTVIPLVVNYGTFEHHGGPPHPWNGSGTCWVKNTKSKPFWKRGILTCRHVNLGLLPGSNVSLDPSVDHSVPTSAALADIDECTIDASIMEVKASEWPSGLHRLAVQTPAAPGQLVEFRDRNGTAHKGSVLRVFHFGTYAGNLFGQRVITDCRGTAGDSGSLLRLSRSGPAVGIYMGTIPDGQGGKEGIFQDLAQVQDYFGLELFI